MRENKISKQGKNHNIKTRNVKDSDHQTGEIPKRFKLRLVFSYLLLRECRIGFPKTFFHYKIVREGETLPHEGKVVVFGVLFPKKFKKCFSQSGALPNSNFPTLPIPHSLILRKNHAPISFSCVDIVGFGFLIKIAILRQCLAF